MDIARLRELAQKATPGPWRHACYMSGTQNVEYPGARGVTFVDQIMAEDGSDICHESDAQKLAFINVDHRPEDRGNDADPQRTKNAAFIAATDPPTVLALLDALESTTQRLERAEKERDSWRRIVQELCDAGPDVSHLAYSKRFARLEAAWEAARAALTQLKDKDEPKA